MAKNNIGPRRLVVGAHYGVKDWLAQRLTAIVMAVFTVVLLVSFLTADGFGYEAWAGLFARQWFKLFALVTFFG
uniref:succinate dehydrogenase, hydrophobic membrane anchor protein n=1 Tax=Massilia niastensis TaxID=544911 RepID=UPI00035F8BED